MATRLNKYIRSGIVSAAMDELPQLRDFDAEAKSLVDEAARQVLPKEVLAVIDADLHDEYLQTRRVHFASEGKRNERAVYWQQHVAPEEWEPDDETKIRVFAILREEAADESRREEIESALRTAVNSVQTVEKLIERYPDLERYVSSLVHVPTTNLPAIIGEDPIAKLRAMGWPH